jgi:hypothetical protein
LRVCCTPLPAKGSSRFVRAGEEVARRRPVAGYSPRGAVRTLRRVPLVSSRKRITATVAFLSLPSCPACEPAETGWDADRDPRRRGGRTPCDQPGRGSSLSRRAGRPIPEGNAAPSSEERGAGVPRGTGAAAPKSRSSGSGRRGRRSEEQRGPALSRRGMPAVPEGGRPAPKSGGRSNRGGLAGGAPKSPGSWVPGGKRSSEELRCRSRGGGADAPKNAGILPPWRVPAPFGSRGPRGVPTSGRGSEELRRPPGGSGVHARRLGRCARRRFRCGDAPVRLRGPPHHRARDAGWSKLQEGRAVCPVVPVPKRRRPRGTRATSGGWLAPGGAGGPSAGPPEGGLWRSATGAAASQCSAPAPAEAGVGGGARRNLAKQPTSRRCSADESVASHRRCQRRAARIFHGLCGPLQGHVRSAPSRRCQYRRAVVGRAEA